MDRLRYYADWLFKDLHGRRGGYIIGEVPNLPLIIFVISLMLAVVLYPGFLQTMFIILAYASLTYWSYLEVISGRSRFRKLLGILGFVSIALALMLRIGV
ncbi:MAG TPA: hypothetical protein VK983_02855 [Candidatus Limnocylindrales bacterium]|nr:hypothetical protein [Candidatus Limnocylindrales bacterium]